MRMRSYIGGKYPLLLGLLCFMFFLFPIISDAGTLCAGDEATLECLKTNFDKLYSTDYKQFGVILRAAKEKALRCASLSEVRDFINLSGIQSINVEFNEFLSENIENICITKPQCFMDALMLADKESKKRIVEILKYPLITDESKIREVFVKYSKEDKYDEVTNLYFGSEKN